MTTKKPEVKKVDKFKTNPVAKKIKSANIKWEEQVIEALETAEQVKSWNKYGYAPTSYVTVAIMSILLGFMAGVLTVQYSMDEVIKVCSV